LQKEPYRREKKKREEKEREKELGAKLIAQGRLAICSEKVAG